METYPPAGRSKPKVKLKTLNHHNLTPTLNANLPSRIKGEL